MPRAKTPAALLLAALLLTSCAKNGAPVDEKEIPIACRLNSLTPQERAREGELLREHVTSIRETRERDDGYSFRYPSDPALFPRMAELVTLEHRCCPFLNFRLDWSGNDDAPWLHVTGGARVKSFVADTFGKPPIKVP
jgi:hypothetical protein